MLKLPNVTLIALTGKEITPHMKAIQQSCMGVEWGDVKLIYQPTIKSIDEWNKAVIYELHNYVQTDYAMLIHADGHVVRPDLWREEFLSYDYVGAPWPLPTDGYSYRTLQGDLVRVGNSVSLRSKRIMELPSRLGLEWKPYYGNTNEDGALCVHWREQMLAQGIKYAPLDVAKYFSKEWEIPENMGIETFAFHTPG